MVVPGEVRGVDLQEIRAAIRQLPPADRVQLLDELLAWYAAEHKQDPDAVRVLETAADVIAHRIELLRRLARR